MMNLGIEALLFALYLLAHVVIIVLAVYFGVWLHNATEWLLDRAGKQKAVTSSTFK